MGMASSISMVGHLFPYDYPVLIRPVEFRLLVFRPYKHTILTALITSSSASGISLRTPFFSDLFVPANALPAGAYFDSSQQHFVLRYAADTENDDDTILHYDMYDTVRVRVETEEWVDQAPEGPEELALDEEERKRRRRSPWSIQCSMMEDGLGPIQWWDSPEEEEAMRE
jgi:DNA-directed RNA polymerase III subunit RPC8